MFHVPVFFFGDWKREMMVWRAFHYAIAFALIEARDCTLAGRFTSGPFSHFWLELSARSSVL